MRYIILACAVVVGSAAGTLIGISITMLFLQISSRRHHARTSFSASQRESKVKLMATPIEPFDHPHLSNEVNQAIRDSDKAGGIWLKDLPLGHEVRVQTRNTLYAIKRNPDEGAYWLIRGHAKWCPDWSQCSIHGSTFGRSMLKMGFVGRGMYLEFSLVGEARQELWLPWSAVITTSQIQDCWESDEDGARFQ